MLGPLYPYIKLLHVLLAIVAVGFNASYGIWLARAAREPEHLGHVLRGIKILDDRFANPAYGLLLDRRATADASAAFWMDQLRAGQLTAAQVFGGIASSPEYFGKTFV